MSHLRLHRFFPAFLAIAACGSSDRVSSTDDAGASPSPTAPTATAPGDAGPVPILGCGESAGLPPRARLADDTLVLACDTNDEMGVTALGEGMVRLRYGANAAGSIVPYDKPALAEAPRTGHVGEVAVLCTRELEVRVVPGACKIVAKDRATGETVLDDGDAGGFFRGTASVAGETSARAVLGVARTSPSGERFYGLGLHTKGSKTLDLRGTTIDLYNTDAYDATAGGFRPDAPSLYESIPFYIGLRGKTAYGLFTDNTHRMRFDLAASAPNQARTMAFGGTMDQVLVPGPSMREVVRRYTALTGRIKAPPTWALGFHQSRWEGPCEGAPTDRPFCSGEQLKTVVRTFREKRIPLDALFLDIQHMRGMRTFTFDPALFPNPSALFRDLEAMGVNAQIIVDPALKIDPAWDVYSAGLAGGHYLKTAQGAVFQGEVWPGPSAFPDFSAKRTRDFFAAEIEKSTRLGLRGMWIDMNEPSNFVDGTVPDSLAADGNGRATTMAEVHNTYAYFEAMATYEGMTKARPDERPFVLSRAAFAGQQKYSAVWTGDAPSTWTTLEATLPQLLHLGLSGMALAGSDVGGYSGRDTSPELFSRWMALGAISPFFRAHAERDAKRQEPWAFGEDVESASRDLISLRYALLPYLVSQLDTTVKTGIPLLRPLVLDYQDDENVRALADEAMLGDALLTAPLLRAADGESRSVYFPAGTWFEVRSGAAYEGGKRVTFDAKPFALPVDSLPMFAREGAIVPMAGTMVNTGELAAAPLVVNVFPGEGKTTFVLHEDDGKLRPLVADTAFTRESTPTGVRFSASAPSGQLPSRHIATTARFVRIDQKPTKVTLDGASLTGAASATNLAAGHYFWDPSDRALLVPVAPGKPFTIDVDAAKALVANGEVEIPIRVELPPGTPQGAITVASSASAWQHLPLVREGNVARGSVRAPRGSHVFFKVTRGGWPTVEKGNGCVEIGNRHTFGSAAKPVEIIVRAWADGC